MLNSGNEGRRAAAFAQIEAEYKLFANSATGRCDPANLGTIIRAVGLNPTEEQVQEIGEMVVGDHIDLRRLQEVLGEVLVTRSFKGMTMVRHSEALIYAAFESLDPEGKGYIEGKYLRELLSSHGSPMNTREIEEMLEACEDPETGRVYYEDYAYILATE